jgi:Acetyltransferase (GNAT) domain
MTRQRLGVPVQPHRYFRVLWRRMIHSGVGFVAIASIGDTPVAAAVFLTFNGTIVYKYGASDPSYWNTRANHLLFWEAIRWACGQGFHTLDFGRTGLGDASLREFKSRWGTVERSITYTVIADDAPPSRRDEVPSLAREVIRRSPTQVTRGLGSILYRYTA